MYSPMPFSRNLSILFKRTGSPRLPSPSESEAMMRKVSSDAAITCRKPSGDENINSVVQGEIIRVAKF
jgi:hypothetical protein